MAISSIHSILAYGQPVLVLTPQHQTPGRVAATESVFKSLALLKQGKWGRGGEGGWGCGGRQGEGGDDPACLPLSRQTPYQGKLYTGSSMENT